MKQKGNIAAPQAENPCRSTQYWIEYVVIKRMPMPRDNQPETFNFRSNVYIDVPAKRYSNPFDKSWYWNQERLIKTNNP